MTDLFRAHWTADIHDEWMRNLLLKRPELTAENLRRTRELMDANVRDALVTGYEPLIPAIQLPDADDRHVVAAAIRAGAQVIVTFNERDFPNEVLAGFGLEAQHPDTFVSHLFDLDHAVVLEAVKRQRASLSRPPVEPQRFIERLRAQGLPIVADILAHDIALI
jgi:hypothetical protein